MISTSRERPASTAVGGGGYGPSPSVNSARKRSIKNPFRRHEASSSIPTSPSLPPPAYSTLPSSRVSTAPSKNKAASIFSWKSGKMSWAGFSSLKGKSSEAGKEEKAGHPELPSSADRLKSTWKRRQNRHGVLNFEFEPPFIVELDQSLPLPLANDDSPPQNRTAPSQSLSPTPSQPFPTRSTFAPSPVPPVSPNPPALRELPSPIATARTTTSRLPRISETQTRMPTQESKQALQPSPSPAQASPDLVKHAFSDRFPLPPSRRPSSAELVSGVTSLPAPTKSLLSPPRTLPPSRFTSSNLPRPKNGPFKPSTVTSTSRLPSPPPSIASTRSTPSTVSRPVSQTSIRKPISIPARPRSSPRLALLSGGAPLPIVVDDGRNSWASTATATRSSSASGQSDETIVAGGVSPIDLKKRTSLVVPGTIEEHSTLSGGGGATSSIAHKSESERLREGEVISEEDRKRFEREVEEMFSDRRMQDLLVQLGI